MDHLDRLAEATQVVNARLGLLVHSFIFLFVNALLLTINLTTSTRYLWFWWPLAGWGAGLLCHACFVLWLSRGRDLKRSLIERELQARAPERQFTRSEEK